MRLILSSQVPPRVFVPWPSWLRQDELRGRCRRGTAVPHLHPQPRRANLIRPGFAQAGDRSSASKHLAHGERIEVWQDLTGLTGGLFDTSRFAASSDSVVQSQKGALSITTRPFSY